MSALPRTTPEENTDAISDQDRDSLHSLPVMILPVLGLFIVAVSGLMSRDD